MPEERTLKITCDECGYSEEVPHSRLAYEEAKWCPECRKGKMWWVPPAEEARRREVRRKAMPEAKISPAVIILPIGLGLGLAAALGIAALARAARPTVFTCPYCGATFATEEELNYHIQTEHPEVPVLARLLGMVTDAETGAPLAGVNVALWDAAETEMRLSTFTDSGGNYSMENILPGSYVVYFYKDGYEAEQCDVVLVEGPNELNIGIKAVAPPGLVIWYGTGAPGMLWDVTIEGHAGVPSGLKETNTPTTFPSITSPGTYEMRVNIGIGNWTGPFRFTLKEVGEYYWDPATETLDGIPTIDITDPTKLPNKSFITGIFEGAGTSIPYGFYTSITVLKAEDVPGYENLAKRYIGKTLICVGEYPPMLEDSRFVGIKKGLKVSCYATLKKIDVYGNVAWDITDLRAYKEYPPEAYNFWGSLRRGEIYWVGDPTQPIFPSWQEQEIHYQVSGGTPPFAAVVVERLTWLKVNKVGPGSGMVGIFPRSSASLYAHPNPNQEWYKYNMETSWEFFNWTRIASV